MLSWRHRLRLLLAPGMFPGITGEIWRGLLQRAGNTIDSGFRIRSTAVSACSMINSALHRTEEHRYGDAIARTQVREPVFVLGHWRSGTTHLHNLLAQDERFAYPTTYQVFFPNTFLTTEASVTPWLDLVYRGKRLTDNTLSSMYSAAEDEIATCITCTHSPYMSFVFPRNQLHYDRYLTFRDVSIVQCSEWKKALARFLQKLTLRYRRPLLLKSPPHTCRIRLLLQRFPDARFVHIHRHPYHVYQSTYKLDESTVDSFGLQTATLDRTDQIIRRYRAMYEVYFDERGLIPPGHLCEVSYEGLIREPLSTLRNIYEQLSLSGFEHVASTVQRYLASVGEYRTNLYFGIQDAVRDRIDGEWRQTFEEWGYSRDAHSN